MAKKKVVNLPEGDKEEHERRLAKSIPGIGSIGLKYKCKNKRQKELVNLIWEKDITIITGPAGTGKSYISLACALDLLKTYPEEYKKLMLIYPTECDDEESLGYLPGNEIDKISPYSVPDLYTIEKILNQSTGKEDGNKRVEEMVSKGIIEMHPTTYLRGLTIDNAIICLSEAQNLSENQVLKILTRIGTNAKTIISGDIFQCSAKSIKKGKNKSGLRYAIQVLSDLDEIGCIEFLPEDIFRNPLISKILMKWSPEEYGYLKDAPGVSDSGSGLGE